MKRVIRLDAEVGGVGGVLRHAYEGIPDIGAKIEDRLRGAGVSRQMGQEMSYFGYLRWYAGRRRFAGSAMPMKFPGYSAGDSLEKARCPARRPVETGSVAFGMRNGLRSGGRGNWSGGGPVR
jgi:hypothetical protein